MHALLSNACVLGQQLVRKSICVRISKHQEEQNIGSSYVGSGLVQVLLHRPHCLLLVNPFKGVAVS